MTLKDQMAADVTAVFVNLNEFAFDVAVYKNNAKPVTAVPWRAVPGPITPAFGESEVGLESTDECVWEGSIVTLVAALGRLPQHNDTILVGTGQYAGEWSVDRWDSDEDMVRLVTERSKQSIIAGRGARPQ